MKSFATSIAIRAHPEAIWPILTDLSVYPQLDPAISKVEGRIGPGEAVIVHANGRAFKLTVVSFVQKERMVWSGGMPFGLFTGTRTYTLSRISADRTGFSMREDYAGLMAPLITRSIPDLQPSFEMFAANLKQRAESSV